MHYDITTDKTVEKELLITIPSSDLNVHIEKEIKKIRKELNLKGFRKGKVPVNIIRTRYYETLKAQALQSLITESFLSVVKEKKWQPATKAEVLDIKEDEAIQVKLRCEVIPDFEVSEYQSIEILKEQPLPDDFLIERALNDLRERYATIKEVSRAAAVDDYVTLDMTLIENAKVKTRHKDITVKIGDRNLPDELNRVLVGSHKGDTREAIIDSATHKVVVKKIEEKQLPLITDEFAQEHDLKDLEHLKSKVLVEAKKYEEQRVKDELKEKISKTLIERTTFTVPQTLIKNEYEQILKKVGAEDTDSNKERFWDTAEKKVRLHLILDKIAQKENIVVKNEEITNVLSSMGIKTDSENREDILRYIETLLMRDKTLEFLYDNAKISERSRIISPKEAQHDTHPVRH